MRRILANTISKTWRLPIAIAFLSLAGHAFGFHGSTENLLGLQVTGKGLEFQVRSGGCTDKRNFMILSADSVEPTKIRLVRIKADTCEAHLPYGTKVHYTYAELGIPSGSTFVVGNPLASLRAPT